MSKSYRQEREPSEFKCKRQLGQLFLGSGPLLLTRRLRPIWDVDILRQLLGNS
jgi:hypothetical protein